MKEEDSNVNAAAHLKATQCQGPHATPEARRDQEGFSYCDFRKRHGPFDTLVLDFLPLEL